MSKSDLIEVLRHELDAAIAQRRTAKSNKEKYAARLALRRFQADRMTRTHADLLRSAETQGAATFFLNDLYGPHDLSERDAHIKRALPTLERFLPEPALASIVEAVALDSLSEQLDATMAERLGVDFDEANYIEAYRTTGTYDERAKQLNHIERLGNDLCHLVRIPLIGKTLGLMKGPARLARVSQLQDFLERGFKAFEAMKEPEKFVVTIVARERLIMERLYKGNKTPFMV